jgi:hypothetical protein
MSDDYFSDLMMNRIRQRLLNLEIRCLEFLQRTGLKTSESVIVYFRGKSFIQWQPAVSVLWPEKKVIPFPHD